MLPFLEVSEDVPRIIRGPVAQDHGIVPIVLERNPVLGFDHQRTVGSGLFLEGRVTVVPVRPGLNHLVLVVVRVARRNPLKTYAGHPVHLRRHENPVPVNGRVIAIRKCIGDVQLNLIPLFQVNQRTGHGSVLPSSSIGAYPISRSY